MIILSSDIERAIRAQGESAYPNECCGFLIGTPAKDSVKSADEIIPVTNSREPDEQYHRFSIEPDDFLKAQRAALRRGKDILGFYHSHPDHPAEPSDYDRECALPFYSYIIVSVEQGVSRVLLSWELALSRESFEAEELRIY